MALPTIQTAGDYFSNIGVPVKNVTVLPPIVIALTANTAVKVYDPALHNGRLAILHIHNVGTVPVKYSFDQGGNGLATSYHDILAAGVVAEDGLGSSVDLGFVPKLDCYVMSEAAGGKIAVTIGTIL